MTKITPQNATEVIERVMLSDVLPVIVDLEKSEGNRLYDSKENKFYLDCISYIASNPLGHNHPKLNTPEFEKEILKVGKTKPSCSDFHTVEMAEFVETFRRVALPAEMKHLFLVEGGSVAVENGLKTAFDWKIRKNFAKGEKLEKGNKVLHFQEAFHGRGGYTLSLTNTADPKKTKYFPKFNWPRVVNPKIKFPLNEANLAAVKELESQSFAEMEAAFKSDPDDIALIIIETIQGEGGDNHFRKEFHQQLKQFADSKDVMLMYDEVQSGCGLTGKMWAYQNYDVKPDIVSFGKKMQVCGIMVGDKVDQVENNVFKEHSRINSTWGGGLVDMVRAKRYLEIIEEDQLLDNARNVGSYLQEQLLNLNNKYPQLFNNARGLGLMCAIDICTPEKREQIMKEIHKRGALLLKCGTHSLRLRPTLTFSKQEVDLLASILEDSAKAIL